MRRWLFKGGVVRDSSSSTTSPPTSRDGNSNIAKEKGTEFKKDYMQPHPIWSEQDVNNVKVVHISPPSFVDKCAYRSVSILRKVFDFFTAYHLVKMNEARWIRRIIFLETIAGVPGMVGAVLRHLRSLRSMKRDHGWIHTLLEEAENERMHLLVALEIRESTRLLHYVVLLGQGFFVNIFFLCYLVSPRYCHRFVGYLEEEAVKTYSTLLKEIDNDHSVMASWRTKPAPKIARNYWKLKEQATLKDVVLAMRADEAHHRDVNHMLSDIKPDQDNPYGPGE